MSYSAVMASLPRSNMSTQVRFKEIQRKRKSRKVQHRLSSDYSVLHPNDVAAWELHDSLLDFQNSFSKPTPLMILEAGYPVETHQVISRGNIYTISIQYLHNIYTPGGDHGRLRPHDAQDPQVPGEADTDTESGDS